MTQQDKFNHRALSVVYALLSVPYAIFQGFVLSKLWTWFVEASFSSAPHLAIINWMGITLLISALLMGLSIGVTSSLKLDERTYAQKASAVSVRLIAWPLCLGFALLIGFVYSLFM
jgi:hypothetical protein